MIIILRHAQAENNTKKILAGRTPGINLTDDGKKQAEQAGKMLESLNVSAIYSSPIDRAVQTAEVASKHCNVEYKTDDRLIELDMGQFTLMPYQEIFKKHLGHARRFGDEFIICYLVAIALFNFISNL